MMKLTNEGKKTLKRLNFMAIKSPQLGQRILNELGADAEKEIRPRMNIDTASMVSTLRKEIGLGFVKIIVGGIFARFSRKGRTRKFVDYAIFVNDGTIKQQGTFFMERGVFAAFNKLASIGRQALDNWLRSIIK